MLEDEAAGAAESAGSAGAREKRRRKAGIACLLLLAAALAAGAGFGIRAARRGAGYIATGNARVAATLIPVAPPSPGALERLEIFEGRRVGKGEVLGWVENAEPMRSPASGVVIRLGAVQGQMVSPMEPFAIIADTGSLHILANIEEAAIARVRVGQPATVAIDPLGRRRFAGYVSQIGSATVAELAGAPIFFNTGGNFARVAHLIPVRIRISDDVDLSGLIGANARVQISLRQTGAQGAAACSPPSGIAVRGAVESARRRSVYGMLASAVERVYVAPGDRVDEGQALASLDAAEAGARLAGAEAALAAAEIQAAAAAHSLESLSALSGAGGVARGDLRQAQFALQSAAASRQQAQAQADAARIALERAAVRSPISGTVTAVAAREGSMGNGLLFVVEDTDSLRVMARFREPDLRLVQAGMSVVITSDATGSAEYAGVISRINPAAAPGGQVAEFEAEVLVTSKSPTLRIGSSARLDIVLR